MRSIAKTGAGSRRAPSSAITGAPSLKQCSDVNFTNGGLRPGANERGEQGLSGSGLKTPKKFEMSAL
jgi:hypothetical protein